MEVNRRDFLKGLKLAKVGQSTKGLVDQADCFVFHDGWLTTFNGEIRVLVEDPCGLEGAVSAAELLKLVDKFPDDVIDISQGDDGELRIKSGKQRRAGVKCCREISLDTSVIGNATDWVSVPKTLAADLEAAARVCGSDPTLGSTTCVRILSDRVEACDNFRAIRILRDTGIKDEIFIAANNLTALKGREFDKVCSQDGWCHFNVSGGVISLRGRSFSTFTNTDEMMEIEGDEVLFPKELRKGVERAQVTTDQVSLSTRVAVRIKKDKASITSRSGMGWYEEDFKLNYTGPDLQFEAHPESLLQILDQTFCLQVGSGRLIGRDDRVTFVIAVHGE